MGAASYFSVVLPSVLCFFLPTYMHQLIDLEWMVLPSAPNNFFFILSFFSLGTVEHQPRGSGMRYMSNTNT